MGPSVAVLVPPDVAALKPIVAEAIEELDLTIEGTGDVEELPAIELRDADGWPYELAAKPWPSEDDDGDEQAKVPEAVGFHPRFEVELFAGVNDESCHRTLGRLALDLAERTRGWINLDGALCLPGRVSVDWDCSLTEIHEYGTGLQLPGRLRAIEYETARATPWVFHLMDAEALRAWLEHPDFHLVK